MGISPFLCYDENMSPANPLMHQANIVGPAQFEIVAAPRPTLHGPGEILLRTAACGICSGDLMPWYLEKKVGTVLGHEVVGRAVAVGPEVSHIRAGDLVFVHHHAPCRECDACRRKNYVHCPTWRASKLDPGGMAEYIRVPAVNVNNDCFAVNDLSAEQAVFIEPLGCSVKAVNQVQDKGYRSGAVIGCGVMGLLNLAAARALGIARLVAVEPDAARRNWALTFGADEVFTDEEARQGKVGPVDFVIIGPGFPEVIGQSLTCLRPGGTAVLFTPTPTGVRTSLDLGDLYFREINLVPSYSCGPEDTRQAYQLLREKRIPVEKMVTHRFGLAEVQKAYDTARRGGAALKVLVTFKEKNDHASE